MPATVVAALLLATSVVLGTAAVVRRSRRLGWGAAVSFALFLAFTGFLLVAIRQM